MDIGKVRKDLRLLVLTSRTIGGQGGVSANLAKAIFEEGVKDITFVKYPNWYNELEYHVKKLDSSTFSRERNLPENKDDWIVYNDFSKLLKDFNAKDSDVIHLHCNQYMREMPWIKGLGVPMLYTCHSLFKYELKNGYYKNSVLSSILNYKERNFNINAQESALFSADKIQAMTEEYKKIISEFYPSLEEKIVVIPNGNPYGEDMTLENKEKDHGRKLLSIGRITPGKGHKYLIEALPKVKEKYRDIELDIIGEDDGENLYKSIRKNKLEDNVRLHDFKTRYELTNYLSNSNLFILPSLNENYPLTILEAIHFKIPIICSNVGGLKEMLSDKECIKVEPKDVKGISNAVLYALDHPEKMVEKADRAHKKYLGNTWKNVAREVLNVYETINLN